MVIDEAFKFFNIALVIDPLYLHLYLWMFFPLAQIRRLIMHYKQSYDSSLQSWLSTNDQPLPRTWKLRSNKLAHENRLLRKGAGQLFSEALNETLKLLSEPNSDMIAVVGIASALAVDFKRG